jgi:Zn-dependent M28 family amino/carboxypeptidase
MAQSVSRRHDNINANKEYGVPGRHSTPQAFDLATRVSLVTHSTHREVESANLVARLEGSDPALKDEHVVYIAHVDHFGRGVPMNGDDIYNGAHDNASGVAIVLEVAHASLDIEDAAAALCAVPVRDG